ncbi:MULTISPECIES: aldo/keto reductase [unclassified Haladaptatus]|uniref:aldo/keto reductase n=1 Tax=unclassified Haladaptatus TaxID=2622732 RepID=UPI0023E8441D|nr:MULTISPECIES: aldo/keto reductase [unclassified Haladaptatus]
MADPTSNPTSDDCPRVGGMPILGLGTWENDDQRQCAESVKTALEMGYRHIDTAQIYGNEEGVGRGIEMADVDRDSIFLATKVWIENLSPEDVVKSTEESLDKLNVDYVDLLYVHWPADEYDAEETLEAFEALYDDGKVNRIGVSNFEPEQLEAAQKALGPGKEIFANQVEMHPLLPQRELREYCAENDIELVAYSPLARGDVFDVPELSAIADDHGVSEAQVSLAWLREKGVTAIPKATSEEHVRDNWHSLDFELSELEVTTIDELDRTERKVDPSFAPW